MSDTSTIRTRLRDWFEVTLQFPAEGVERWALMELPEGFYLGAITQKPLIDFDGERLINQTFRFIVLDGNTRLAILKFKLIKGLNRPGMSEQYRTARVEVLVFPTDNQGELDETCFLPYDPNKVQPTTPISETTDTIILYGSFDEPVPSEIKYDFDFIDSSDDISEHKIDDFSSSTDSLLMECLYGSFEETSSETEDEPVDFVYGTTNHSDLDKYPDDDPSRNIPRYDINGNEIPHETWKKLNCPKEEEEE